ncbi:TRM11 family SAM-dependent methyltransferase [Patescibacteria group bacterium]
MLKTFFQLGQNQALSLAEVIQVIPDKVEFDTNMAFSENASNSLKTDLFGGIIRIGSIIKEDVTISSIPEDISSYAKTSDTKYIFGLSVLNNSKLVSSQELVKVGISAKKLLRKDGARVRYVNTERDKIELSAGSVIKNKLFSKGNEFVVVARGGQLHLGITTSIQDVDDYARRDEERPCRDPKLGMLPVKIARIMINLSGADQEQKLLDPFCGLGTILQEGLSKGLKVYGSDIQEAVIRKAEKNLKWFAESFDPPSSSYYLKKANAIEVNSAWKNGIDTIVTEGFLGRSFRISPTDAEVSKEFTRLEKIYIPFLKSARLGLMKPNARIVIAWPYYPKNNENQYAPWLDTVRDLGYNQLDILESYRNIPGYNMSRKSFLYARKKAFVGREITVWTH